MKDETSVRRICNTSVEMWILYFLHVSGGRKRVPLVQSETEDSGLLRHAAELKKDEKILVHIRGKDCVAIEVRYHKPCYMNYTSFLIQKEKSEEEQSTLLYQKGYEKFCQVIEKEIIGNKQIRYMTDLFKEFVKIINSLTSLPEYPLVTELSLLSRIFLDGVCPLIIS